VGLSAVRRSAHAGAEAAAAAIYERSGEMNKARVTNFRTGDEISYAGGSGMIYGEVTRVIGAGESAAIEIQWEDGRKEIKPVKDRALALLRRASGASEEEERHADRGRLKDPDIESVRRSEQRKRW
jgi:hypothetical protein